MLIKNHEIYGSTKEIRRIARRLSDSKRLLDRLKNYPEIAPVILCRWSHGGEFDITIDSDIIRIFFGYWQGRTNYDKGKRLFPNNKDKAWKYAGWKDKIENKYGAG